MPGLEEGGSGRGGVSCRTRGKERGGEGEGGDQAFSAFARSLLETGGAHRRYWSEQALYPGNVAHCTGSSANNTPDCATKRRERPSGRRAQLLGEGSVQRILSRNQALAEAVRVIAWQSDARDKSTKRDDE